MTEDQKRKRKKKLVLLLPVGELVVWNWMCWIWSAFGEVTAKYNDNNDARDLGRKREAASHVGSERR